MPPVLPTIFPFPVSEHPQRRAGLGRTGAHTTRVAGALAVTRTVKGLLFGVTPGDPLSLTVGIAVLALTAALAAWIPSRRAARVDPMVALKYE
jgi:hypothetical protein